MNSAHLHLALNHAPVLGVLFGLLLLAYGGLTRSEEVSRAALWSFVVVGLLAVAVYLTGEGAEEVAERLSGVDQGRIEPHEEMALLSTVAAAALALLVIIEFALVRRTVVPTWMKVLAFGGALVVSVLMARTAYLGGAIRHPEIDGGGVPGLEALAGDHGFRTGHDSNAKVPRGR